MLSLFCSIEFFNLIWFLIWLNYLNYLIFKIKKCRQILIQEKIPKNIGEKSDNNCEILYFVHNTCINILITVINLLFLFLRYFDERILLKMNILNSAKMLACKTAELPFYRFFHDETLIKVRLCFPSNQFDVTYSF